MSPEPKNTYRVMGDQLKNAVVLWATTYRVLADRLLCFGRPVRSYESRIHKAFERGFYSANHL